MSGRVGPSVALTVGEVRRLLFEAETQHLEETQTLYIWRRAHSADGRRNLEPGASLALWAPAGADAAFRLYPLSPASREVVSK